MGDVIRSDRLQHRFHKGLDVVALSDLEPVRVLNNPWLVVNAVSQGGSRGSGRGDDYPDGWNVTVKMLCNDKVFEDVIGISFYQSGSFSVLLSPKEIGLIEEVDIVLRSDARKKTIVYNVGKL